MKHVILATLAAYLGSACIGVQSAPTQEDGLSTTRVLSLRLASEAAWVAIEDCRRRGHSVAVTLVDRGGNIQVQLRDRLAGPHTPETSYRKAWTANSFRQSTADLASMLEDKRIPNQVQHNPGALLVGGGEVIAAVGEFLGGIGVAGAPPGKSERDSIDGACASAGVSYIREQLELE